MIMNQDIIGSEKPEGQEFLCLCERVTSNLRISLAMAVQIKFIFFISDNDDNITQIIVDVKKTSVLYVWKL